MQDSKETPPSGTGFFVRLYWIFAGNILLFFLLVFIVEKHPKFPSLLDATYGLAVASLILARYVDIRFLNGTTGDEEPATMTHWRRYATLMGSAGVGAWILAHLIVRVL